MDGGMEGGRVPDSMTWSFKGIRMSFCVHGQNDVGLREFVNLCSMGLLLLVLIFLL